MSETSPLLGHSRKPSVAKRVVVFLATLLALTTICLYLLYPHPEPPSSFIRLSYELDAEIDREILPVEAFEDQTNELPTQIRGQLYVPSNRNGALKFLIFAHGNHQVCDKITPNSFGIMQNLCTGGTKEAESDRGYEYLVDYFTSKGYAILAPSFNTNLNVNNNIIGRFDPIARAGLIIKTMKAFEGPLRFIGGFDTSALDLSRVGIMGHSRGGEACRAFLDLIPKRMPSVSVKGIFEIAPTDFSGSAPGLELNAFGVPWAVIVPTCDMDVTNLGGYSVFRRMEKTRGDAYRKSAISVVGANHNMFNTEWKRSEAPAFYPTCKSPIFEQNATYSVLQQETAKAYLNAFFDAAFAGEDLDLRDVRAPGDVTTLVDTIVPKKWQKVSMPDMHGPSIVPVNRYYQKELNTSAPFYASLCEKLGREMYASYGVKIGEVIMNSKNSVEGTVVTWSTNSSVVIPLNASLPFNNIEMKVGRLRFCHDTKCDSNPLDFNLQILKKDGTVSPIRNILHFGVPVGDGRDIFPLHAVPVKTSNTSQVFDLKLSPTIVLLQSVKIPIYEFGVSSSDIQSILLLPVDYIPIVIGDIFATDD